MRFVYNDTLPNIEEDLNTNKFSSLEEVFETIGEDDFYDKLSAFLDEMPRNRKSTEEILKEIKHWDNYELYMTLLTYFIDFLTDSELSEVIDDYKRIFCIPLPNSIEKDISDRLNNNNENY